MEIIAGALAKIRVPLRESLSKDYNMFGSAFGAHGPPVYGILKFGPFQNDNRLRRAFLGLVC